MTTDILIAIINFASTRQWADLSMAEIAVGIQLPLSELEAIFINKTAIEQAYSQYVTTTVLTIYQFEAQLPLRERLFDILMLRFEILNQHRAWVLQHYTALKMLSCHSIDAGDVMQQQLASLAHAAGMRSSAAISLQRPILLGMYWHTFKVWSQDTSPELGNTMATLDQTLQQVATYYPAFFTS